MFGRALVGAGGSGASDDTGAINPAALSRTFASFLRKGQVILVDSVVIL